MEGRLKGKEIASDFRISSSDASKSKTLMQKQKQSYAALCQ